MNMATPTTSNTPEGSSATLKAYQDKITAQIQEAKSTLEQFEAKAKEKKAEAEITAINKLKTTKQNIDQKLQDLKTTNSAHMTQAKAEIDAEVAKFKASIDEVAAKVKSYSATK
jgi:hypothetical protein